MEKRDPLRDLMSYIAYPMGTVLEFHLRRILGRDPKEVLPENPREYYRALVDVFGGEGAAIWLIRTALEIASFKTGIYLDPVEFVEAIRRGDREILKRKLEMLESALPRGDGELRDGLS